jgi:Na+/H+ antiporter NhaC
LTSAGSRASTPARAGTGRGRRHRPSRSSFLRPNQLFFFVFLFLTIALAALAAPPVASAQEPAAAGPAGPVVAVEPDGVSTAGGALHLKIALSELAGGGPATVAVSAAGREVGRYELGEGEHEVTVEDAGLPAGRHPVSVALVGPGGGGASAETEARVIPGWLSVVPPLIAIGLALIFKDVLISLFLGVFGGALILYDWHPITAFARTLDRLLLAPVLDPDRAKILVFTILLGGLVGVIGKSGGTLGIVARISPLATNARRGQLATWALGILVFFDDYANTLIVGSTMRPITDRLRISREKLAYIVDSTAAPVASLFPISTWIGFEVGLIAGALAGIGVDFNAYGVFIASIPYRFYPIFALVLGVTIAASCRDFGPMLTAERRASDTGKLLADGDTALAEYGSEATRPPDGIPRRAFNALVPIGVVVTLTVVGLWLTGAAGLAAEGQGRADFGSTSEWLREVFASSDPYTTLLWGSGGGLLVAVLLPLVQRLLSVRQTMEAMVEGFKSMFLALVVLVLAWSIGEVCGTLHTAGYLVGVTAGALSPHWLPALVFVVSAVVSFATGTSWGTMGILIPLVVPLSHGLSLAAGHPPGDPVYFTILLGTVSSVLAGSVWGDHCSPISDTTLLSSIASGSDHIAHVRTQLPYALGIGMLGILIGDIPTAFGLSPWVSLAVGAVVIVGGVLWLGKRSDWRGGSVTTGAAAG